MTPPMTSALDQKGLEAAKAAYQQGFVPHEQCLEAALRAYLSTVIPAEIAGVVVELKAFAAGCRGSMWQSRDETIRLMDKAATLIERLAASQAETRRLALEEAIEIVTAGNMDSEMRAYAGYFATAIRSLIDQPTTDGGKDG